MFYFILFIAIIGFIYWYLRKQSDVESRWVHLIEGFDYSTEDFYKLVESQLAIRQLPDISISRDQRWEAGVMSPMREYFRVQWNQYVFHICAGQYGNGFFISEWRSVMPGMLRNLFKNNEKVSTFLKTNTYYQHDLVDLFRMSVHQALSDAIDDVSKSKGIRPMTELEKQIHPFKKR